MTEQETSVYRSPEPVLRKNLLQLKRRAVQASIRAVDRPGCPSLWSHNHVAICACGFWVLSKGWPRISPECLALGWSVAVLCYSVRPGDTTSSGDDARLGEL